MPTIAEKRRTFRQLHESGCFVIPNPWDTGSARYLQGLGFKALASTSAGFAWSLAHPDATVPREAVLAHLRDLVTATDVPLNADFENGFASDPDGVTESVRLCVETGVAGLSIEDSTHDPAAPLLPMDVAVERMRAARGAIDAAGGDVILTGRAECFVAGLPDLDEAIARLRAYSAAGADCLYAPGITTREQIAAVVAAVAPKPVNLLVSGPSELSVDEIASLGVRRVSVGGGLARVAWTAVANAATVLAQEGSFAGFRASGPSVNMSGFFREDMA
ncbi:MAG: isocitrate lyase/phosphoenolpyruvate mutase family protein, partial [Dehalococcoidia bacterium]